MRYHFAAMGLILALYIFLFSTDRVAALWIAAGLWLTDLIWAVVAAFGWRQNHQGDGDDPDAPHNIQAHVDTMWSTLSRVKGQITMDFVLFLGGMGILRPVLALRCIVIVGLAIYVAAIIIWVRQRWSLVRYHEIGWPEDRWWGRLVTWLHKPSTLRLALGISVLIPVAVRLQLLPRDLMLNLLGAVLIAAGVFLVSITVYDVQVAVIHRDMLARRA